MEETVASEEALAGAYSSLDWIDAVLQGPEDGGEMFTLILSSWGVDETSNIAGFMAGLASYLEVVQGNDGGLLRTVLDEIRVMEEQ